MFEAKLASVAVSSLLNAQPPHGVPPDSHSQHAVHPWARSGFRHVTRTRYVAHAKHSDAATMVWILLHIGAEMWRDDGLRLQPYCSLGLRRAHYDGELT